jgi:hypothetical protein
LWQRCGHSGILARGLRPSPSRSSPVGLTPLPPGGRGVRRSTRDILETQSSRPLLHPAAREGLGVRVYDRV